MQVAAITLQGVLFRNGRAVGALHSPKVICTELAAPEQPSGGASGDQSEALLQEYSLDFRLWTPARAAGGARAEAQELRLPVDGAFASGEFRVQIIGTCGGASFALPHQYTARGRELAAGLSVQRQRLDYVRQHQRRRSRAAGEPAGGDPAAEQTSTVAVESGERAGAQLLQAGTALAPRY